MNKFILLTFYSIIIPIIGFTQIENKNKDKEISKLSYYMGYLIWRDYLNKTEIDYDVEQIVKGIEDGRKGKCQFKDDQDFASVVGKFKSNRTTIHSEKNLKEATKYLADVAQIPQIIEVRKGKLYYLISEKGLSIPPNAPVSFKFSIKQLMDGELKLFYATTSPVELDIEETIDGFKEGIKGIKKGEKRIIYIHPELAYGMGRVCISPNVLIVFEVEAL